MYMQASSMAARTADENCSSSIAPSSRWTSSPYEVLVMPVPRPSNWATSDMYATRYANTSLPCPIQSSRLLILLIRTWLLDLGPRPMVTLARGEDGKGHCPLRGDRVGSLG